MKRRRDEDNCAQPDIGNPVELERPVEQLVDRRERDQPQANQAYHCDGACHSGDRREIGRPLEPLGGAIGKRETDRPDERHRKCRDRALEAAALLALVGDAQFEAQAFALAQGIAKACP